MTKEEAIHEIEKVFEPAFANYIITALTEGATSSDKEQQFCEDCISREAAIDVVRKWFDKIQLNGDICLDGIISLPSITPRNNLEITSQDLDDKYEMGYNCGYADAMSDIAESEGAE